MPEHVAKRRGAHRCSCPLAGACLIERGSIACVLAWGDTRRGVQRKDRRVGKLTERPRLRRPVEVPERLSEGVEMMLRPVVIAVHGRERRRLRLALVEL